MTIINPSIKQLIESGWSLVPCKKNEKFNSDTDILTRDYVPGDFIGDGNVAVNNEKTNLIDWDCDDHWSKLVSREMLSSVREASTIERHPVDDENLIETTHYLFTKNLDIDWDSLNLERKDLNLLEWLQHLQEELMDAACYVEKLKEEYAENNS